MEANTRPTKRGRYMSKWESLLYEKNRSTPSLSVPQLFDARRWQERPAWLMSKSSNASSPSNNGSLVRFRLEHRHGGATATHPGEERILLFRSDRKGSVGKIIFSYSNTESQVRSTEDDSNESCGERVAHAKVHLLDVKPSCRGYDFGGLLFSEALLSLRQSHRHDTIHPASTCISSIRCQLDAEEDIRRHDKLVGFYKRLGCTVKPKARPQFLSNNDGETYKRIPMQIDLKARTTLVWGKSKHQTAERESLLGNPRGFIPVLLLGAGSKPGKISSVDHDRVDWLMVEDGHGHVQFRTTRGHYLTIDSHGICEQAETRGGVNSGTELSSLADAVRLDGHFSKFQLFRVSDSDQHVLSGEDCGDKDDDNTPAVWTEKELWVLLSPHNTYLNLDPVSLQIVGSNTPAFWLANSRNLSLTCTTDTPARRQHYRRSWIKQTVEYVQDAENRYRRCLLGHSSLRKALDLITRSPAFPFRVDTASRRLSLRTLCFRTAEAARSAGHPDWIQFLGLVHALGSVINYFDIKTATESEDDFDWSILCCSRVVGCACPDDATLAEFRGLDDDRQESGFNSLSGMYSPHCGLENVKLSWTGPEYMRHVLKHNNVDLPDEAFSVLRLFLLYDWHTKNLYENLANDDDVDVRQFVISFDRLRRQARQECLRSTELSNVECDRLWDSHYAAIVAKFDAGNDLKW